MLKMRLFQFLNSNILKYEVETRFYFNSKEEIYKIFPQFINLNFTQIYWETSILSKNLFFQDNLLRISKVEIIDFNENSSSYKDIPNNSIYIDHDKKIEKNYLGYKENDIGSFCNIRKEIDEEFFYEEKKLKNFIIKSNIIKILKLDKLKIKELLNKKKLISLKDLFLYFDIEEFLYFNGKSEVSSISLKNLLDKNILKKFNFENFEKLLNLKVNLKIMFCDYLIFPILLEIEFIASNKGRAFFYEKVIEEIAGNYKLINKIIKKEPPQILFDQKIK